MKVIIIGLPYFARKIAAALAEGDPSTRFIPVATGSNQVENLRFFWHLLSARTVYLVGGQYRCGGALGLARLFKKKIVMHWVGTDVLLVQEAQKKGLVDLGLIRDTKHLCEIEWMRNELSEAGIVAGIATIATFSQPLPVPASLPAHFSVLSYIGKGRELFYGLRVILATAELFPEIPFRVVGIESWSEPTPQNVQLLGWIDDMASEFERCVLYLRLPNHDGLSFSVLEALSHGRYVGYACPLPGTNLVQSPGDLQKLVRTLVDLHGQGALEINWLGYNSIVDGYIRPKALLPLLSELLTKE